ncbi:prepilin-type N-terminal cleavage/methylation domain-containing protein [Dyella sp. M7H15-1]|uniref:type IV pilin protein n=1 Tax=Dyella sp. M7H15-1 TaxID=2501295 RepID=UPI0010051524|nr:type IV pilin protein [Dyella sp. M7H15-1]QAU23316.1 prepilin-type N-terminal cleavage/methylation domain-containing protein [Dyella sp. M7H15-1]
MERPRGFTLLEVIIVVAIVAILAALATSSYSRYVLRSHRADAHQALMAVAHGQERWYATYNRYTDDLSQWGYTEPATSPNGYYELVLEVDDDARSFVARAIPVRTQAVDVCGSLSIDNRGNKLPERDDAQANANGRCW